MTRVCAHLCISMKHRWFRAEMPATPVILAVREDGLRRALGIGCREWSESEASLTMGKHLREWRERRVAALRDSHPFLFCTWPFNPRLPRLLPSQPSRLGLTYREAAERLRAVFVCGGRGARGGSEVRGVRRKRARQRAAARSGARGDCAKPAARAVTQAERQAKARLANQQAGGGGRKAKGAAKVRPTAAEGEVRREPQPYPCPLLQAQP